MEISPSSTSPINVLSSQLSSCVSTDECKPGDEIIVEKDTYILDDNGVVIPVPAGTVAVLLPDSDDEDSARDADNQLVTQTPAELATQTSVDACELPDKSCLPDATSVVSQSDDSSLTQTSVCISEAVKIDAEEPLLTNEESVAADELVQFVADDSVQLTDLEATDYSSVCGATDSVALNPDTQDTVIGDCHLDACDNSPSNSVTASDLYFQEEEEVIEESVTLLADTEASSSLVAETETETFGPPIVKPVRRSYHKKSAKTVKRQADKGVPCEYVTFDIDSCASNSHLTDRNSACVPDIDASLTKLAHKQSRNKSSKTPQEELESKESILDNFIMDGTVKADNLDEISTESDSAVVFQSQHLKTSDIHPVSVVEDADKSSTQKPEFSTETESQGEFILPTADESIPGKLPEIAAKNSPLKSSENMLEKQRLIDVRTAATTPAQPAVSASGRPQRSTPRRSAYELLHGLVHRSAGEHDSDQTLAKKSKGNVIKKNADVGLPLSDDSLSSETNSVPVKSRMKKGAGTVQTEAGNEYDSPSMSGEKTASGSKDVTDSVIHQQNKGKRKLQSLDVSESQSSSLTRKQDTDSSEHVNRLPTDGDEGASACSELQQACDHPSLPKRTKLSSDQASQDSGESNTPRRGRPKKGITKPAGRALTDSGCKSLNESRTVANDVNLNVTGSSAVQLADAANISADDALSPLQKQSVGSFQVSSKKTVHLDCNWQGNDVELSDSVGTCSMPGFPYHSFTSDHQVDEVKSGWKSSKNRQAKAKGDKPVSCNGDSLAAIEKMQARIRELEADVNSMNEQLAESKKQSASNSLQVTTELSLSSEEATDRKMSLERWEKKLRALDLELEERATALMIRQGQIVRHEQRLMEKERRLRQLDRDLLHRKRQATAALVESASTGSAKAANKTPSMLKERLEAEEHRLELKRRELDNEKSFLEDEKKKLVEKELELESREQAAVDADLFSFAHGFSASVGNATSVVSSEKQSNGKMDVHFSDDDDDGFDADIPSSNSSVPVLKHCSYAALESEDDDISPVKVMKERSGTLSEAVPASGV